MLTRPHVHHSANPALTRTPAPPRPHFRRAPTTPRLLRASFGCAQARATLWCPWLGPKPLAAPLRQAPAAVLVVAGRTPAAADVARLINTNDA